MEHIQLFVFLSFDQERTLQLTLQCDSFPGIFLLQGTHRFQVHAELRGVGDCWRVAWSELVVGSMVYSWSSGGAGEVTERHCQHHLGLHKYMWVELMTRGDSQMVREVAGSCQSQRDSE